MAEKHWDYLDQLEAESIYILREVAGQFEKPCLLFSGGKDSITLVRLAEKAFRPGKFPFPLLHIDTGHNFEETLTFRDHLADSLNEKLIIRYVQDSIDQKKAVEQKGKNASRNTLQTVTLLEGPAAMKKKPGPKNAFFQSEMNLDNGIRNCKDQNYGIFLMVKLTKVKM